MAKPSKTSKSREAFPKLSAPARAPAAQPVQSHATRETVEALVIAFVLAFLIRTFEVEAFVIPTGSMAPTLMGRHKDVYCPQCGHRFQVTDSEEESDEVQKKRARLRQGGLSPLERARLQKEINAVTCVAGMCPVCRYVMPMENDLPPTLPGLQELEPIVDQPSYNGDRIIVNKYIYTMDNPERWDIIVFKFPGNAQMNYIKRLVGLPGEVVRVYQGDIFVAPNEEGRDTDFAIARKPPDKVLAMRQLVHDTNYDPASLYEAGWPLRWRADSDAEGNDSGWSVDAEVAGHNMRQRFACRPQDGQTAWLRYHHFIPDYGDWQQVEQNHAVDRQSARPKLITDFNAYNARVLLGSVELTDSLRVDPAKLGIHWVGDLMVEADVEVQSDAGQLLLDLVEGGKHFTCRFDLSDGTATLSIDGLADFQPSAQTPLDKPGNYRVRFANVDDQLLVWVDGRLVAFDDATSYDADRVFGDRRNIRPETSATDAGDLAPVGIGASDAELEITRLQVWRDIYYIADSWQRNHGQIVTDYNDPIPEVLTRIASDPSLWDEFLRRRHHEFPLEQDQLFVMGDNSPESLDARLWRGQNPRDRGRPGGAYLERNLLIGKALFVYWPHSWNRIPGTPIPFPLFPNFADMRMVR